jgi:hypothetical protein
MTVASKFPYQVQIQSDNTGEWATFYSRATLNEARKDKGTFKSKVRIVNVNTAQVISAAALSR